MTMSTPKATPTAEEHDDFLKLEDAAADIGCGVRWLRDGANHYGFPHDRYGKALWFSRQQRAEIRAMHRQPARWRRSKPRTRKPTVARPATAAA
ncbi:hypothetical protein [Streptomyces reniochalinae]|uniref:DNA-binding protein n=1 Tax=Streptomyces reniochalinae TaxID=2250578 RepID=A0A367EVU4_9ACTN|nr:hypothetical protein [Streptomyces reniochalinae]RCG21809.1 hypothetical protein DQ392_08865 [Streptomyces reniochalinae]